MIEPPLPLRIESVLYLPGKLPQRNAIRRIEDFMATIRCDSKYGSSLSKIMGPRKAAPQGGGTKPPQLSTCVPPFSEIHLSKSRNDQTKLQKPVNPLLDGQRYSKERRSGGPVTFDCASPAAAPPSVAKNFRRSMWLAMRPSGWGSFMQWRDDTTFPSRGL
jgi:hypothetical protein